MRKSILANSALTSVVAITCAALASTAYAAEFKTTYEEIVEAAKTEPAVEWCTGMGESEAQPIIDEFAKMFPGVPKPNSIRCRGVDITQRIISEWRAGAPQVDVLNIDSEMTDALEAENITHVADWSVFDGTPVEVDPRYLSYGGRFFSHGTSLRVNWFNPKIIAREDVPKSLEECADPKYKGIIAVDVRPSFFEMMEEAGGPWSDEKIKEWAEATAELDPLWIRGPAHGFQVLASGERGLICGHQFHGLFRGGATVPEDPDAIIQYTIPEQVIAREYGGAAIAPAPLAPNGAVLFGAFLASNAGHAATEKANGGYSSPFIEGSLSNRAIKEAGAEVIETTAAIIGKVAERLNTITLTAWGFPSPAAKK